MTKAQGHVVLGVTGSIAAYKAAEIIRRFRKNNYRVSVIMTRAAEEFITPLTLGTLSGEKVWRSLFDHEAEERAVSHLSLSRQADVLLIAPASADIIGKIANGLADDLLSTVAMAVQAPIVIAPAMNVHMYHNPIVQGNCARLKKHGVHFVGPVEGSLACGECADGRLAEIDDIVKETEKAVQNAQGRKKQDGC